MNLAAREGFEPSKRFSGHSPDFKFGALDRSATSPDFVAVLLYGGEGEIRTPEAVISNLPRFECGSFGLSDTSP